MCERESTLKPYKSREIYSDGDVTWSHHESSSSVCVCVYSVISQNVPSKETQSVAFGASKQCTYEAHDNLQHYTHCVSRAETLRDSGTDVSVMLSRTLA